ncbi:MAG: acetyl-CoA carboxylase biotin carboxyl carrier protein [Nitrospirae bacterium]|nr:MAG: acetyl-CoA carboxylase biotin carboxyl carrier protein [Nitrospirota bacterium]
MDSAQRKEIQELVQILTEQNLTEIEIEKENLRIRIRKDPGPAFSANYGQSGAVASSQLPVPSLVPPSEGLSEKEPSRLLTVHSPIVGTFYRAPSPEAEPYVEEGDIVKKGQVLCIIEAMKLMNEIESETDGRIVKILVENASAVEYGQPLFLIDPTPVV